MMRDTHINWKRSLVSEACVTIGDIIFFHHTGIYWHLIAQRNRERKNILTEPMKFTPDSLNKLAKWYIFIWYLTTYNDQ